MDSKYCDLTYLVDEQFCISIHILELCSRTQLRYLKFTESSELCSSTGNKNVWSCHSPTYNLHSLPLLFRKSSKSWAGSTEPEFSGFQQEMDTTLHRTSRWRCGQGEWIPAKMRMGPRDSNWRKILPPLGLNLHRREQLLEPGMQMSDMIHTGVYVSMYVHLIDTAAENSYKCFGL